MGRKFIDCRDHPGGDIKCTVALSADNEEELLDAVMQHATTVHGFPNTSEVREQIRQEIKEGSPRA